MRVIFGERVNTWRKILAGNLLTAAFFIAQIATVITAIASQRPSDTVAAETSELVAAATACERTLAVGARVLATAVVRGAFVDIYVRMNR